MRRISRKSPRYDIWKYFVSLRNLKSTFPNPVEIHAQGYTCLSFCRRYLIYHFIVENSGRNDEANPGLEMLDGVSD